MENAERGRANEAKGLLIRTPSAYDLQMWLFAGGRERAFREAMLRPAELQAGEAVLDVGCGTGSLAILAAEQVGPAGIVCGVDASEEMVGRAARKVLRAGVRAEFKVGSAQNLPFGDDHFNVVLSTIMLHHLPRPDRERLAVEMKRVLRPGGRALIVDFGEEHDGAGLLSKLHKGRHGHTKADDVVAVLMAAGLEVARTGQIGKRSLHYVIATKQDLEGTPTLDGVPSLLHRPHSAEQPWPAAPARTAKRFGIGVSLALVLVVILHVGAAGFLLSASTLPPMPSTTALVGFGLLAALAIVIKIKFWHRLHSK